MGPYGQADADGRQPTAPKLLLQAAAWKPVVDAIHKKDSIIFLQAWHMGRATHSSFLPGNAKPISASATAIQSETYSAT